MTGRPRARLSYYPARSTAPLCLRGPTSSLPAAPQHHAALAQPTLSPLRYRREIRARDLWLPADHTVIEATSTADPMLCT
jgi:hypothetical protein